MCTIIIQTQTQTLSPAIYGGAQCAAKQALLKSGLACYTKIIHSPRPIYRRGSLVSGQSVSNRAPEWPLHISTVHSVAVGMQCRCHPLTQTSLESLHPYGNGFTTRRIPYYGTAGTWLWLEMMTLTEKDRERKSGLLTCMYATKLCTMNFLMAIGSAAATAVMQHHLKILSLLCDLSSALGPYCRKCTCAE